MFGNYTAKDYEKFNISVSDIELAFVKKCPDRYSFGKTDREFYGLVYITSGELIILFDDGYSKKAVKGDILYLEKGSTYRFNAVGDERLEYIVISFDIKGNGFEKMLPFERVNTPVKSQRFEELFNYICDIWYVKSIGYLLHAKSMIGLLIYEFMHDCFSKNFNENTVGNIQAAAEYIERNFDKDISAETLAKLSCYSTTHFRRKFREIYGVSPVDYINRIRVEKAKDMLKAGIYSIEEISSRCGFNSLCYFTRVFKKITGTTPGKY